MPMQAPQPSSLESILILEPVLGLDVSHPSVNDKPGSTPYSINYIIRDGGLEPRPMLSYKSSNVVPIDITLGGAEIVDVTANRYPVVSGSTQVAWFSTGSWSGLSYIVSQLSVYSGGVNQPPAGGTLAYYDFCQIYDPPSNQNMAVFGNGSAQSLFCWQSGTTVFSTLTGAPGAKFVTAFNDFLVAGNVVGGLVQRVQWSDRGSNSSWTGGLSGFADLLDMRGQIQRIATQETRLVIFSEYEVWEGLPAAFPYVFTFDPIDRSVGCPYSWTVSNTPIGQIFLSSDYNVYLISKWGGPARSVGDTVQKYIRENLNHPERAWATYDRTYNQYQLYFPTQGGSGYPQQALFLNVGKVQYSPLITQIGDGAWALQQFDPVGGRLSLTRGFEAQLASTGTTWSTLSTTMITWANLAMSWAALGGVSELRATHVGSSAGTQYFLNSTATSDQGIACRSIWRSSALFGFEPNRQKTMNRIRIDYQTGSASTLSLEASRNQGASFDPAISMALPANSQLSEAVAHFYTAARYPMFQISSEAQRYRIYRFWMNVRAGGR